MRHNNSIFLTAALDTTKAEKRFRTLEEKLNLPSARIGFEQIDMRITNRRGKNHPFAEQTRIFRKLALLSLSQSFLPARHFVKFIIRDL